MLKFILLVIFLFLLTRMVFRLVRRGLFLIKKGGSIHGESSSSSFSSERHIEETDYEVIESRLNNNEQDVI
jgi:hypothetical protein